MSINTKPPKVRARTRGGRENKASKPNITCTVYTDNHVYKQRRDPGDNSNITSGRVGEEPHG